MAQSIVELAAAITRGADALNNLFVLHNLQSPSFFADPAEQESSKPFMKAKNDILDAALELCDLLLSPAQLLRVYSNHAHLISLHFLYRFNIAQIVPPDRLISYAEIASQCNQPKRDVQRLMRHAITIRLFDEPRDGFVRHTRSSLLLRKEAFYNRMGGTCEDNWPAATKFVDSVSRFPGSESPNESGFALTQPNRASFYEHLATSPTRSARFTKGRESYSSDHKPEINQLLSFCRSLAPMHTDGAVVVDIGGASGWVSVELSKAFPNTRFIVQDLASVVATAKANCMEHGDLVDVDDLNDSHAAPGSGNLSAAASGRDMGANATANATRRLSYRAYDFFTPQPVRGALIYYMRWILHNHSDLHAARILQNLAPAMQGESRLLIHDYVLDSFADMLPRPLLDRRMTSSMDIGMQMLFNARERNEDDWKHLLAKADSRFELFQIHRAEDSSLALIEVRWTGSDEGLGQ